MYKSFVHEVLNHAGLHLPSSSHRGTIPRATAHKSEQRITTNQLPRVQLTLHFLKMQARLSHCEHSSHSKHFFEVSCLLHATTYGEQHAAYMQSQTQDLMAPWGTGNFANEYIDKNRQKNCIQVPEQITKGSERPDSEQVSKAAPARQR